MQLCVCVLEGRVGSCDEGLGCLDQIMKDHKESDHPPFVPACLFTAPPFTQRVLDWRTW